MKPRFILLLFLFSSYFCATPLFRDETIHPKAELGKVCLTSEGDNLILSKAQGQDKIFMSKLDKNANFIYYNKTLNLAYTGNAQITQSKLTTGEDGYILYHKSNGKEYFTELKDQGVLGTRNSYDTYAEQAATLTLKNGKIFFVGIIRPSNDLETVRTAFNLRIFDPLTGSDLQGETIYAYSKYISCSEQKDNEVYCAYVYQENPLRSLLGIQYFKVTDAGIVQKGQPFLIKAFYTQFNYVKVIKYNTNEVGIFFQTGNPSRSEDIPFGNTGKDLYYYHLEVTPNSMQVVRYDYISTNCRFSSNAEDYRADMIAIDETVYVICELENENMNYAKAFRGYIISKDVKRISYIDFNRFNGKGVKNPQFVKFNKNLAVLYTEILSDDQTNVNLLLMNYPNCEDSSEGFNYYGVCPANNQVKLLNQQINISLVNPYPMSMKDSKMYFRFVNFNNMVVYNGDTPLELNKDYDLEIMNNLLIKENHNQEGSYLEYVASRLDSDLGAVIGKTCKIKIENIKCLDQCNGCDAEGTSEEHHCFDCKDGFWHEPKGEDKTGCGYNKTIYNCQKCDVACLKCYGPFLESFPPTTNCIEDFCDIENGYYPYEDNLKTCIKESEKKAWEERLKLEEVLFLDKNGTEDKKQWLWRKCHPNCAECVEKGDNTDNKCLACKPNLFFYCNQTKENGGIPGNCHVSCEENGCYKSDPKDTEGFEKMCPCLENCKTCKNKDYCEECWATWLLQPEKTSCNKSCDYCFTPYFEKEATKEKGRCVNCSEFGKFTYDNKCYDEKEIPYFNYTEYDKNKSPYTVQKFYHVIDEK